MNDVYLVIGYWKKNKELVSIKLSTLDEIQDKYGYTGEILREVEHGDDYGMVYRFIKCEDYKDAIATIIIGATEFYVEAEENEE